MYFYTKTMNKIFTLLLLFFSAVSGALAAGQPAFAGNKAALFAQMSEDQKIQHLIDYVRNLQDAVFIRNGKEYSPAKAADHLQSKWKKHKKKIDTAHDFVTKLASKSKTDEPYQIKFKDGHTIKCGDLLAQELAKLEQ